MATKAQVSLQALRSELNSVFLERQYVIDGLLTAFITNQHALLLGPPGTGKSALVSRLAQAFEGDYFQRLLTKFSVPEELFGPYALSKLKLDQFERITAGYLPTADYAFLDEVFKANSSILNALLTLLEERAFDNGTRRDLVPLKTAIGASNELPEGEELNALFDRFIWRYWVDYLKDPENVRTIMTMGAIQIQGKISPKEAQLMRDEIGKMTIGDHLIDAVVKIKTQLEDHHNIVVSDRRWQRVLGFVKAYAYVQGSNVVTEDHLEVLTDCLWSKLSDRKTIQSVVVKMGNPITARALDLLDQLTEVAKSLGNPPPKTDPNRTDWIATAASVNDALDTAITEIAAMLGNSASPPARAVAVKAEIERMKHGISQKILSFYQ